MAYETIKEFPLANIVRVEIETEEETPKMYRLTDVASEAEITAFISEGEEQELRVKKYHQGTKQDRGYSKRI